MGPAFDVLAGGSEAPPVKPSPTSNAEYGSSRSMDLVPEEGVEPTRPCGHRILSPARLPVPPLRACHFKITCRRLALKMRCGSEPAHAA